MKHLTAIDVQRVSGGGSEDDQQGGYSGRYDEPNPGGRDYSNEGRGQEAAPWYDGYGWDNWFGLLGKPYK